MATTRTASATKPSLKSKEALLSKVSQTMLVTLNARAKDANQPNSILHDTSAAEILDKLGYRCRSSVVDGGGFASMILRAHLFDSWAVEFLNAHPEATVLHLGCGLDSRALRLKWGPRVRWIDVDQADVVALRRELLPDPAADGADYQLLASSIADESWLESIPADRPTLIIMEGLVPYLDDVQVRRFLDRTCRHFPTGQVVFDIIGTFMRRLSMINTPILQMIPLMRSFSNDGSEYDTSSKLVLKDRMRFWQAPARYLLPWYLQLYYLVLSCIPGLFTLMTFLKYEF